MFRQVAARARGWGQAVRALVLGVLAWAQPYWTRGEAGRETPADLFRVLYSGWLVAFLLKVLGASWDVSWHFKWLRDDLAPPHLLNSAGTAIAVAWRWCTGTPATAWIVRRPA